MTKRQKEVVAQAMKIGPSILWTVGMGGLIPILLVEQSLVAKIMYAIVFVSVCWIGTYRGMTGMLKDYAKAKDEFQLEKPKGQWGN